LEVIMGGSAFLQRTCRAAATRSVGTSGLAVIAFIVAGMLLGACSNEPGIRAETPTATEPSAAIGSSTGSASTLSPNPTNDAAAIQAQVQERYKQYRVVVAEAGAASDPDDPRLADYATGGVLANLRGTFALRRTEGRRLYGQAVPHVSAVSVTDNRATVEDCLDNSATGLMDAAGTKLNVGRAKQLIIVSLVQEGGVWKVAELTTVEGGGGC